MGIPSPSSFLLSPSRKDTQPTHIKEATAPASRLLNRTTNTATFLAFAILCALLDVHHNEFTLGAYPATSRNAKPVWLPASTASLPSRPSPTKLRVSSPSLRARCPTSSSTRAHACSTCGEEEDRLARTSSTLCTENYHWHWRAFMTAGASAFYVFANALIYWITKLRLSGLAGSVLYIGYSALVSFLFFILTGSIGFFASWLFVQKIYGSIKID